MQAAIRLAMCLVMAGASVAVFADGSDATSEGQKLQVTTAKDSTVMSDSEEVGHGSGEPGRSASQIAADQRTNDEAIRDYNARAFLAQVWTSP